MTLRKNCVPNLRAEIDTSLVIFIITVFSIIIIFFPSIFTYSYNVHFYSI